MAPHVYMLYGHQNAFKGQPAKADLSVMVIDANGKTHGRNTEGFKWALDIEGAVDMTAGSLSLRQVNNS